jgi:uncharacterized protein (TIGR02117 family)
LKKVFKWIGKTILGIVAIVLLYLLSAFCLSRITIDKEPDTSADVELFILTNGVHTDIVVPARNEQMDWRTQVKLTNTKVADSTYKYLAMGWGDKGFYLETPTWADLKAKTAFKAAFALSTTAIHATYYSTVTESETCKKMMISKEQYTRLINYITDSFQKDANGNFMPIVTNANYGDADAFYEAYGSYSVFKTCNSWANKGLKECGQKCCFWTAFDTPIFMKYNVE